MIELFFLGCNIIREMKVSDMLYAGCMEEREMTPFIEFKNEDVKLDMCYRNEAVLKEVEKTGNENHYLPKLAEAYDRVIFPYKEDYPYTFGSIVLSFDGKMAFPDMPEGPIISRGNHLDPNGALADFWVLNNLRAYGDAVIVGAKTLEMEQDVWMTVHDEDLVRERLHNLEKDTPHPKNIIISLDGTDIPTDHQIFSQKEVPVSIFTSPIGWENLHKKNEKFYLVETIEDVEALDQAALKKAISTVGDKIPVVVTGEKGMPDTKTFLKALKKADVHHLIVESPTYMWHLMSVGLLDEIFLNYSSVFVGGTISPGGSMSFTSENHPHGDLLCLARHNSNFMFTRQKLVYGK